MRWLIETPNRDLIKSSLDRMKTKIAESGMAASVIIEYKENEHGIEVGQKHHLENRVTNRIMDSQFKKTVKQIDPKAKVTRID